MFETILTLKKYSNIQSNNILIYLLNNEDYRTYINLEREKKINNRSILSIYQQLVVDGAIIRMNTI